jgi:hypothetical protein
LFLILYSFTYNFSLVCNNLVYKLLVFLRL